MKRPVSRRGPFVVQEMSTRALVFRTRPIEEMPMKRKQPQVVELDSKEMAAVRERVAANQLNADDCKIVATVLDSYACLLELLRIGKTSLARLQKLLFGAKT
jgi:hypothetical protein